MCQLYLLRQLRSWVLFQLQQLHCLQLSLHFLHFGHKLSELSERILPRLNCLSECVHQVSPLSCWVCLLQLFLLLQLMRTRKVRLQHGRVSCLPQQLQHVQRIIVLLGLQRRLLYECGGVLQMPIKLFLVLHFHTLLELQRRLLSQHFPRNEELFGLLFGWLLNLQCRRLSFLPTRLLSFF